MSFMDKIRDLAKITDEGYFAGVDDQEAEYYEDEYEDEEQEQDVYSVDPSRGKRRAVYQPKERERDRDREREREMNVVDIHSSARSQVVFKKIDRFDDVGEVADVLNEKRIVILNLETCPNDISRRVLDFLYGVAYANSGDIKRVAGRAYIITPYNVPVTGELLDELESGGYGYN
ncbi:MAG: cell division protein SepF [Oscillospiraceae bacterium]|nr:cell division protein SepF [Oscillospiraceae bacterium]